MAKFYVVWVGRQKGIYATWSECEKQVKGFSGAKFKSFKSREEAIKAYSKSSFYNSSQTKKSKKLPKPENNSIKMPPLRNNKVSAQA